MTIETVSDLTLIDQTAPISPAVKAFYQDLFAKGSGPNGTFLTSDFFGTAAGIPRVPALTVAIQILQKQIAIGTLNNLSQIYLVMKNVVTGVYGEPLWPGVVTIPAGLPGAGTYVGVPPDPNPPPTPPVDPEEPFDPGIPAINPSEQAFDVLIPLAVAAIAAAAAAMGPDTETLNTAFIDIAKNAINEPVNFERAGINFDTLTSSQTSVLSFITALPAYGQNTEPGQSAEVLAAIADQSNTTGQAIVGALREGRNNEKLDSVGINRYNTIPTPD
jgi:hypothetical protein